MSEVKLKPCPFCGGEAKLAHRSNGCDEWFLVICANCNVSQTGYAQTECQAVEAWNTRKPIERTVGQLEELAKVHENICFKYKQNALGENAQYYSNQADKNYSKQIAYLNAIEIVKEAGGMI